MVSDSYTDNVIAWDEKGEGFVVKKEHELAANVLPRVSPLTCHLSSATYT